METPLLYGAARNFRNALEEADQFAPHPWPVLILGETGSGKELVARRLHQKSPRRGAKFLPLNCGALPPGLMESELFGYERGAFSGAAQSTRGLVRQCAGGTLFLDEIGELDLNLQVKLLRLLDRGEVRSVGGHAVERVDVRILAATNVNLDEAVAQGRFRADLLERLAVLTLRLPPLRERAEDLELLARGISESLGVAWSPECAPLLKSYDWPGNVRQLRNTLVRTSVLGGGRLCPKTLERVLLGERARTTPSVSGGAPGDGTLAEIEKQVIVQRLRRFHGNRKRTARDLGIAKSTLHEKLRRWRMEEPEEDWLLTPWSVDLPGDSA